jgi:hypothetical protein
MTLPPALRRPGARWGALSARLAIVRGAARLDALERDETLLALALYARSGLAYDAERQAALLATVELLRTGRRRPLPEPIFSKVRGDVEMGAH